MNLEEFIKFRNVKIRNEHHKKIVRLFYPYLFSVAKDIRLLPNLIGDILDIDLSAATAQTGCFNGITDEGITPYDNVDFYIKFDNGIKVYLYGAMPKALSAHLNKDEYVIIVNNDKISGNIERKTNNHIFIN